MPTREGFLRSTRSLIQTCGRAARNAGGRVIMYGDKVTESMQQAIDETSRRRTIQQAYNLQHGITPQSIRKEVVSIFDALSGVSPNGQNQVREEQVAYNRLEDMEASIQKLEKEMMAAARELEFERAAELRDRIQAIQERLVFNGHT